MGSRVITGLEVENVSDHGIAAKAKLPTVELSKSDDPVRRMRRLREFAIESLLFLCAAASVLITLGILGVLVVESIPFFEHVSFAEFITGTEWYPMFAEPKFGILPLVSGTFLTTAVALLIANPLGTVASVFLSEYVNPAIRESLKPILELLAAVPTVVYGYFALLFVTPLIQTVYPDLPGFNVLSAGIVMGVMIIPYVSSLSEDAMRAVPGYLREGSYAVGATRFQTSFKVVIPAAFSGITSAYILAISRALGETMVVSIAAGMQPNLTIDPREPVATITAFIVQVSLGDLPHGSVGYQSIYVAGLTLMCMTLFFNIIGFWVRKRFRETY
jgi:phosphate transport system permease protein